jgi:hypothetical protein
MMTKQSRFCGRLIENTKIDVLVHLQLKVTETGLLIDVEKLGIRL